MSRKVTGVTISHGGAGMSSRGVEQVAPREQLAREDEALEPILLTHNVH